MKAFIDSVLVGTGAAAGGLARHWLGHWIQSRTEASWPLPTLIINVSGSLLLGVLAGVLRTEEGRAGWQLSLGIGVLGGYTTFSTFSLQLFELVERRRLDVVLAYAVGSVLLGLLSAALGYAIGKMLNPE